jgi:hypothetical protein
MAMKTRAYTYKVIHMYNDSLKTTYIWNNDELLKDLCMRAHLHFQNIVISLSSIGIQLMVCSAISGN